MQCPRVTPTSSLIVRSVSRAGRDTAGCRGLRGMVRHTAGWGSSGLMGVVLLSSRDVIDKYVWDFDALGEWTWWGRVGDWKWWSGREERSERGYHVQIQSRASSLMIDVDAQSLVNLLTRNIPHCQHLPQYTTIVRLLGLQYILFCYTTAEE